MKKIKVCVATGSRSEFGLLFNLISKLNISTLFDLELIALGSHFDKNFGNTYEEITTSKVKISHKIKIINKDFSSSGILKNFNKTIQNLSSSLRKKKYDIFILLGDRYETFACAIYAYFNNIPIAHIHGGEVTYGSLDDGFRHCITKLSNFHFVSNISYKNRIIQLGETPENVHVVGGLGIENIKKIKLLKKKKLEEELNIKFSRKNILISFHPDTTITKKNNLKYINNLLKVLKRFKNTSLFFTRPNADKYNNEINNAIKKFTKLNSKNSFYFKSLGSLKYLSLLKNVDCLVGNSSSGIIEAPYLKTPTLNIGNRQLGRKFAKSIITTDNSEESIYKNLSIFLNKKLDLSKFNNQYGSFNSSDIIIKKIKKINFNNITFKVFFDIK